MMKSKKRGKVSVYVVPPKKISQDGRLSRSQCTFKQ